MLRDSASEVQRWRRRTKLCRAVCADVLILSLSAFVVADEKPNFSGRWEPVVSGGFGSAPSQPVVVVQDRTSLTVTDWKTDGRTLVHRLYASQRDTDVDRTSESIAWWNHDQVVIRTVPTRGAQRRLRNGALQERLETWFLDRDGLLHIHVSDQYEGGRSATCDYLLSRRQ